MTGRIEKTEDSIEPRMTADDTDQRRNLASALIRAHLRSSAAKTAFLYVARCFRMHPHESWCNRESEVNDQTHRVSRNDSPRFPRIPHPRRSSQQIEFTKANPPFTTTYYKQRLYRLSKATTSGSHQSASQRQRGESHTPRRNSRAGLTQSPPPLHFRVLRGGRF